MLSTTRIRFLDNKQTGVCHIKNMRLSLEKEETQNMLRFPLMIVLRPAFILDMSLLRETFTIM